jgi:hypothetical protein
MEMVVKVRHTCEHQKKKIMSVPQMIDDHWRPSRMLSSQLVEYLLAFDFWVGHRTKFGMRKRLVIFLRENLGNAREKWERLND